MTGEEYLEEDYYPCDECPDSDHCDGWEARFCCTLCHYYNVDPRCEDCDSMDVQERLNEYSV